jgi:hypothetical protein
MQCGFGGQARNCLSVRTRDRRVDDRHFRSDFCAAQLLRRLSAQVALNSDIFFSRKISATLKKH